MDMVFKMMKFTLLYSIFFVLAFQTAFSSSINHQNEEAIGELRIETDVQSQFEENNFSPSIFGEVAPGQAQISVSSPGTECFFYNSNSKDLQISIIHYTLRSKSVSRNAMCNGMDGYCIYNIPIYLQTGNFRL